MADRRAKENADGFGTGGLRAYPRTIQFKRPALPPVAIPTDGIFANIVDRIQSGNDLEVASRDRSLAEDAAIAACNPQRYD
jgi:hypothetical protein